jgi:nucleoside-diphosphate-sugar epimerase
VERRVLVTGATGFLGGAILRRLGSAGVGQGRSEALCADLRSEGFDVVQWQLPGAAPASHAFDGISAIIHCAGLSAPFGRQSAFFSANVQGTQAVLALGRALKVNRVVFISSPSVYFRLSDQLNVHEDTALPRPFTAYAASKIAAERSVHAAADLGPVILRPRGIYGPGDTTVLPRILAAAASRALPRFRDGRARIDLTFVEDVVDAALMALDGDTSVEGRTFNISGGEVLPISQIVESVCDRAGIAPRWRDLPLGPALVAARVAETVALLRRAPRELAITRYGLALFAFAQSLDLGRARHDLGWEPQVRFHEGLARTFDTGGLP